MDILALKGLVHRISDDALPAVRGMSAPFRRFKGMNAMHGVPAPIQQDRLTVNIQELHCSRIQMMDADVPVNGEQGRGNGVEEVFEKICFIE
jgi:hypothetical protein